nr:FAD-binding oxidoreductase [Conexibacter arvalis]
MQTAVAICPDVTVEPLNTDDVIRAVAHAASHRIPLRTISTGHGATSGEGGVLIRTHRLSGVHIDPDRQIADIGPGATWGQVGAAAARHGLAPLSGTAATVGAAGYTVGGGISPLSRRYGYAADHVLDLDLVTPDGRQRTLDAESDPELFWAARGAASSLGVVTRLRFRLFPITKVRAGALTLDVDDWADVVGRYLDWTAGISDTTSSFLSLKNFPDSPDLPEAVRGKRTATIYVTSLDSTEALATSLEPLRRLPLAADNVTDIAAADLATVFNEPTWPHAFQGDAIAAMGVSASTLSGPLSHLSDDVAVPTFLFVHHLGGGMSAAPDPANAIGNRAARYMVRIVTSPTPTTDPVATAAEHDRTLRSLSIEPTGRVSNFLFGDNVPTAPLADCYDPADLPRLASLVTRVDLDNILRPARGPISTGRDHRRWPGRSEERRRK